MTKKEKYDSPEMVIIATVIEDVIRTSTDGDGWYIPGTELGGDSGAGKEDW